MFSLGDVFVRGKRVKILLISKGNGPFSPFSGAKDKDCGVITTTYCHTLMTIWLRLFSPQRCAASAAIKGFASRCHTKPNYALHETFLVLLTAPDLQATRCFMLLQCFWNVCKRYKMSISEKHVGSHFSIQTSHTSRENVAVHHCFHTWAQWVPFVFFNFIFVVVLFK